MLILALAGCTNKKSEKGNLNDETVFKKLELIQPGTNDGLHLWQIDEFVEFAKGTAREMTEQSVKRFLDRPQANLNYYPMLELIYADQGISIFFLLADGSDKGFFMSAFKNNTKISEVNLWKLSGVKEFKELSEKIILDKRVNPDKPYDFQVFSNHYPNGYYVVKVLLNGEIEVGKIEVAEGDIP